jgi:teichuronic acid biosynthesis glycosyltransferase TuaG
MDNKGKTPLVTVIMPIYNNMNTVRQSVDSVLSQTMPDLELFIIDDGSKDNTYEIIKELAEKDQRITILKNECNLGVAASRNKALDLARGEYIAFLDSDDIWTEHKLEKQIALLEKTNGDICYTSYDFIDYAGRPIKRAPYIVPLKTNYHDMLRENVIGLSTALIRYNPLGELRFDSRWFHEDYVLWLTLLCAGKIACGLQEVLVTYRTGGRSSNKINVAKNRWKIYREHQKLSMPKALYYFCCYAYNGIKKRIKIK